MSIMSLCAGTWGADQLVQLEMKSLRIPVLSVLDQKNDQKCHDGRSGIDDELPGVRKMKERTARRPADQGRHGQQEHKRMPDDLRGPAREPAEPEIRGVGLGYLFAGFAERGLSF